MCDSRCSAGGGTAALSPCARATKGCAAPPPPLRSDEGENNKCVDVKYKQTKCNSDRNWRNLYHPSSSPPPPVQDSCVS